MTVIPFTGQKSCCCGKIAETPFVIHLPVAPQVVARTRFSPPPPSRSGCLTVPEAMDILAAAMRKERSGGSTMVAITGPGDPLATPDITLQTIELVRARYPELKIGLRTLGMGSAALAGKLARAGLNYVEMQVDGTKPAVLEKIYAWIRPGMKTLKTSEAVALLINEQRHGVSALKFHELKVIVTTTVYPALNIDHVAKISAEMMELGADGIGLIPYAPEPGAEVSLESPTPAAIAATAAKAAPFLPIVEPLLRERAGDSNSDSAPVKAPLPRPTSERPNVAVVSSNGMEVDLHLGQAIRLLIYGRREDGLACLLDVREAPEPCTPERWSELAGILPDCFVILAASAGETPRKTLAQAGIKILISEGSIEGTVDVLYGGGKKGRKK
ncbi:MAG: hypothetical protein A2X81_17380 [Desulfobacterales bacterium GWB2_56_26]|nr:MAG: hypothetical protein A2X81_17380 [Desulfobacterales bacterium GWB2_56_26]